MREYTSVHDRHCCKKHGCKYGDEDCTVKYGDEAGIKCEYCYELELEQTIQIDNYTENIKSKRLDTIKNLYWDV